MNDCASVRASSEAMLKEKIELKISVGLDGQGGLAGGNWTSAWR